MNRRISNKTNNRQRRGVGAIIGGVILVGILLTSVLVYFVMILNNDKTKTSYEIQSQQADHDKSTESYVVQRDDTVSNGNLGIQINNNGPIPMVASKILVYCIQGPTCASPTIPMEIRNVTQVLNSGNSQTDIVGNNGLTDNNTYKIDVVSERGNVVSASVCVLQNGLCIDNGNPIPPPSYEAAITEGIIQGTGSLQLDFKSFGVIFPHYGTRNGVDQTGFSVKAANATGYPAASVPKVDQAVLVERMRDLDPSKENITLTRQTGLSISLGKATGNSPAIIYVCDVNPATMNVSPYTTDSKVLPYTNPGAGRYAGMTDVFFCSQDLQAGPASWNLASSNKFDNINGLFMVARGYFGATSDFYAQTIPYQSLYIANSINACLKGSDSTGATLSCPSITSSSTNAGYKYSATRANMQLPTTVYLRLEASTLHGPYSVDWVYPSSGKHVTLTSTPQNPDANGNIALQLPKKMEDGSTNIQAGYYTLVVTGAYYKNQPSDTQYTQDVAFLTFQVTP